MYRFLRAAYRPSGCGRQQEKTKGPIFSGSPSKIPVLTNSAATDNKDVHTPNADSLAARGIQFMNAWSVAPQSSAARSSLITGCYSSTYGMDVHPVPYDTPANIFFPQWLREAGYYCTNNSKTHYNSTTDNKSCWDECTREASYNSPKRGKDQPFFAVYNTVTSHMGRIRTFHTDGRRDYTQEGIYPELLTLPAYVPDLPEVRSDYAGHLEAVQDVDTWLGVLSERPERKKDWTTTRLSSSSATTAVAFHAAKAICMKAVWKCL